jgi:hypothetical protein
LSRASPYTYPPRKAHPGIPVTAPYGYPVARSFYDNEKPSPTQGTQSTISQSRVNVFDGEDAAMVSPLMSSYQPLQPSRPLTVQPTTRSEGMVYPGYSEAQRHLDKPQPISPSADHVISTTPFGSSPFRMPPEPPRHGNVGHQAYVSDTGEAQAQTQPHCLDIVLPNERPPPAKRGPFKSNDDREKTAVTRKIGSCIRCKMQRIRVSPP